jgi:DNA-binding SARP family transcriptional activator
MRMQLRLLDEFALLRDDVPVAVPRSGQRLLALLALRGPHPRARMAGLLWPELPDRKAMAYLRNTVWRLQRLGLPVAVAGTDQLCLPSAIRVDIDHLVSSAISSRERTSPSSWELLPGWSDDWVLLERERVRQTMIHTVERKASESIGRGDAAGGLEWSLLALQAAPLRESAHRLVVRAYLAAGNVAEAHRHFDAVRSLFRAELGIAPTRQFWELVADREGISGH